MNHRGGFRNGRGRGSSLLSYTGVWRRDLEVSTDRLSADRLAGVLSLLQPDSPEARTVKLFRGVSQQTSVAEPSLHPDAPASARGGSVPAGPVPAIPVPVIIPVPATPVPVIIPVPATPVPAIIPVPAVLTPAVLTPAVLTPAVSAPAVLERGRHRSQAPRKRAILMVPMALRLVGVTACRFAVTGATVALVAVTIVLAVLKAWVLGVFHAGRRSSADRHPVVASGDLAGPSSFLPKASTPSKTRR
jgi:hypothetical protein